MKATLSFLNGRLEEVTKEFVGNNSVEAYKKALAFANIFQIRVRGLKLSPMEVA